MIEKGDAHGEESAGMTITRYGEEENEVDINHRGLRPVRPH